MREPVCRLLSPQAMDPQPDPRAAHEAAEAAAAQELTDSVIRGRATPPGRFFMAIVALLATFSAIYFAKPVLVPICFAWLLKVALAPIVRRLDRLGVPIGIGSAVVLAGLTAVLAYGIYELTGPAAKWVTQLPEELPEIERKIASLREPIEKVSEVTEKIEKIANNAEETTQKPVPVEVAGRQTLLGQLFSGAWMFVVSVVMTLVLLYFMLATDEVLLNKVVGATPRLQDKKAVVTTVRAIEIDVGRYLMIVMTINVGLGLAVGGVLWLLGMPNPALWGVLAGLLNFVPYIGPTVGIVVVAAVALLTFDTLGEIALPPLAYFLLNALEGLLLTPLIVGRRLAISPVALFIWLLLISWMWGIPGALLAVPLLVAIKIASEHIPLLAPLDAVVSR